MRNSAAKEVCILVGWQKNCLPGRNTPRDTISWLGVCCVWYSKVKVLWIRWFWRLQRQIYNSPIPISPKWASLLSQVEYLLGLIMRMVLHTQWLIYTLLLLSGFQQSNTLCKCFFLPLQTGYITFFGYYFVSLHSDSKNGYFVSCGCFSDLYQWPI